MLLYNPKVFYRGAALGVVFAVVLYFMFTPSFGGKDAFHASDNLFNSISKGSTYHIPQIMEGIKPFEGRAFSVTIFRDESKYIPFASVILSGNGLKLASDGKGLGVSGDLGVLMTSATVDADILFQNDGATLERKYGMDARQVLYIWWKTLKEIKVELDRQKVFTPAAFMDKNVIKRAIEVGYNYFGIEGESAADRWGIISFSLVFYVVYTLWWGYAIFFMFEGLGLEMISGRKREMQVTPPPEGTLWQASGPGVCSTISEVI